MNFYEDQLTDEQILQQQMELAAQRAAAVPPLAIPPGSPAINPRQAAYSQPMQDSVATAQAAAPMPTIGTPQTAVPPQPMQGSQASGQVLDTPTQFSANYNPQAALDAALKLNDETYTKKAQDNWDNYLTANLMSQGFRLQDDGSINPPPDYKGSSEDFSAGIEKIYNRYIADLETQYRDAAQATYNLVMQTNEKAKGNPGTAALGDFEAGGEQYQGREIQKTTLRDLALPLQQQAGLGDLVLNSLQRTVSSLGGLNEVITAPGKAYHDLIGTKRDGDLLRENQSLIKAREVAGDIGEGLGTFYDKNIRRGDTFNPLGLPEAGSSAKGGRAVAEALMPTTYAELAATPLLGLTPIDDLLVGAGRKGIALLKNPQLRDAVSKFSYDAAGSATGYLSGIPIPSSIFRNEDTRKAYQEVVDSTGVVDFDHTQVVKSLKPGDSIVFTEAHSGKDVLTRVHSIRGNNYQLVTGFGPTFSVTGDSLAAAKVMKLGANADDYEIADSVLHMQGRVDETGASVDRELPENILKEIDDLEGLDRPNARSAESALTRMENRGLDVNEARDALDDYKSMKRGDYDDAEEYADERAEAWERMIGALREAEMSDDFVSPPTKTIPDKPSISQRFTDLQNDVRQATLDRTPDVLPRDQSILDNIHASNVRKMGIDVARDSEVNAYFKNLQTLVDKFAPEYSDEVRAAVVAFRNGNKKLFDEGGEAWLSTVHSRIDNKTGAAPLWDYNPNRGVQNPGLPGSGSSHFDRRFNQIVEYSRNKPLNEVPPVRPEDAALWARLNNNEVSKVSVSMASKADRLAYYADLQSLTDRFAPEFSKDLSEAIRTLEFGNISNWTEASEAALSRVKFILDSKAAPSRVTPPVRQLPERTGPVEGEVTLGREIPTPEPGMPPMPLAPAGSLTNREKELLQMSQAEVAAGWLDEVIPGWQSRIQRTQMGDPVLGDGDYFNLLDGMASLEKIKNRKAAIARVTQLIDDMGIQLKKPASDVRNLAGWEPGKAGPVTVKTPPARTKKEKAALAASRQVEAAPPVTPTTPQSQQELAEQGVRNTIQQLVKNGTIPAERAAEAEAAAIKAVRVQLGLEDAAPVVAPPTPAKVTKPKTTATPAKPTIENVVSPQDRAAKMLEDIEAGNSPRKEKIVKLLDELGVKPKNGTKLAAEEALRDMVAGPQDVLDAVTKPSLPTRIPSDKSIPADTYAEMFRRASEDAWGHGTVIVRERDKAYLAAAEEGKPRKISHIKPNNTDRKKLDQIFSRFILEARTLGSPLPKTDMELKTIAGRFVHAHAQYQKIIHDKLDALGTSGLFQTKPDVQEILDNAKAAVAQIEEMGGDASAIRAIIDQAEGTVQTRGVYEQLLDDLKEGRTPNVPHRSGRTPDEGALGRADKFEVDRGLFSGENHPGPAPVRGREWDRQYANPAITDAVALSLDQGRSLNDLIDHAYDAVPQILKDQGLHKNHVMNFIHQGVFQGKLTVDEFGRIYPVRPEDVEAAAEALTKGVSLNGKPIDKALYDEFAKAWKRGAKPEAVRAQLQNSDLVVDPTTKTVRTSRQSNPAKEIREAIKDEATKPISQKVARKKTEDARIEKLTDALNDAQKTGSKKNLKRVLDEAADKINAEAMERDLAEIGRLTTDIQHQSMSKELDSFKQKLVIAFRNEKDPFRETSEVENALMRRDWRAFSRSRGYTEEQIAQYADMRKLGNRLAKASKSDPWLAAELKKVSDEAFAEAFGPASRQPAWKDITPEGFPYGKEPIRPAVLGPQPARPGPVVGPNQNVMRPPVWANGRPPEQPLLPGMPGSLGRAVDEPSFPGALPLDEKPFPTGGGPLQPDLPGMLPHGQQNLRPPGAAPFQNAPGGPGGVPPRKPPTGGSSGGMGPTGNFYNPNAYAAANASLNEAIQLSKQRNIGLDAANAVTNAMRESLATLDFSALLRQTLIQTLTHPALAAKTVPAAFKMNLATILHNEEAVRRAFDDIKTNSIYYHLGQGGKHKLAVNTDDIMVELSSRARNRMTGQSVNDAVPSSVIERIPFLGNAVKGNRYAYSYMLARIRQDTFDSVMRTWEKGQIQTLGGLGIPFGSRTGKSVNVSKALQAIRTGGDIAGFDTPTLRAAQQMWRNETFSVFDQRTSKVPGSPLTKEARAVQSVLNRIDRTLAARGPGAEEMHTFTAESPEVQNLIRWLNISTGAGEIPEFAGMNTPKGIEALTNALFAPRLWFSRLETPIWGLKSITGRDGFMALGGEAIPARVRYQIARDTLQSISTLLLTLGVAEHFGVGSINRDPTSSDFLKLRIGNTRIDPWGGFQQMVKLVAWPYQLATEGQATRTATSGQKTGMDFTDVVNGFYQYLAYKMAPMPSLAADVAFKVAGNNRLPSGALAADMGLDPREKEFWTTTVLSRTVPLFMQDFYAVAKAQGVMAPWEMRGLDDTLPYLKTAALGLPAFFGAGANTFEAPTEQLDHMVKDLGLTTPAPLQGEATKLEHWWQLDPYQKLQMRKDHPEVQKILDNMPPNEVGKITEDREEALNNTFLTYLHEGHQQEMRASLANIKTEFAKEFAALKFEGALNPTPWMEKVNTFFDGMNTLTDMDDKDAFEAAFRRSLSTEERARLDQILQSSNVPLYQAYKTSLASIDQGYWKVRPEAWANLAAEKAQQQAGKFNATKVHSAQQWERWTDYNELVYAAAARGHPEHEDAKKFLDTHRDELKEKMNDVLFLLPGVDAVYYLWGYQEKVHSPTAIAAAQLMARQMGIKWPVNPEVEK